MMNLNSIVCHPPAIRARLQINTLLSLIIILLLQSCSGPFVKHSISEQPVNLSDNNIEALLNEAQLSSSPARDNLYLQAAELMMPVEAQSVPANTLNLLFEIHADQLTPRNFAIYTHLYGMWATQNGQIDLAQQVMDNERLNNLLQELDNTLAIPLYRQRIEFFLQNGQTSRAIEEQMVLGSLLTDSEEYKNNQNALWHLLQQLSTEDKQQLNATYNKQLKSWLKLLDISTAPELDLDEQVEQLEQWLKENPKHPAAQSLPEELKLLQNAQRDRPQHITLLLPLSGGLQKAGEAIRDGFLASYYQSLSRGHAAIKVDVIDSQSSQNFSTLYDQVARNGSQLIIGPLAKEFVSILKQRGSLPVPTLALNNPVEEFSLKTNNTRNLFLFSLNPEDEARQAAARARQNHHKRAIVFTPQSDWGQRINNTFISTWLQVDPLDEESSTFLYAEPALVLANAQFNAQEDSYTSVIQQVLGIEDSKNRSGEIKWWSSQEIEYEPRRRQDIDMIFLAARPEQARQIKPLLSFHYAGDIPVYASSSVYSGEVLPDKDADLNGVQLLVTPWLLNHSDLQQEIQQRNAPPATMQNLYAMGADAWRLSGRLSLLAGNTNSRLYGNTGILQMNASQQITRQLLWAKVIRGKIAALPGSLQ